MNLLISRGLIIIQRVWALVGSLIPLKSRFILRSEGSVATVLGLAMPLLILMTAAGVEYSKLVGDQSHLQNAADAAALGAAKQLNLANATNTSAATSAAVAIARAQIANKDPGVSDNVVAAVIDQNTGVDVTIIRSEPSLFGLILPGSGSFTVKAHSVAHSAGGAPICAIALDGKVQGAITLDASAVVDANKCVVYSDSKDNLSIVADQSSILTTALTCAVGGKKGNYTNFNPPPKSGCPPVADPLASRAPPSVGNCDYNNLVVSSPVSLYPGVYCGGLRVTAQAKVTLNPGIYVVEAGPLVVDGGASLSGTNVGFYLTLFPPNTPLPPKKLKAGPGPATIGPSPGTTIYFAQSSSISLTAPKSGPLAGLLFFEDRQLPMNQLHQILSNNAQTLLGTIYLPNGRLFVGSSAPVAQSSAYTVIVSDTVELSAGPTLYLNSDYGATDIPVPQGVGPTGGSVSLTQ